MKKLHRFLIALSLGTTTILSAQTTAPTEGVRGPRHGGPGGPGRGGHPIIRAVDTDKNGELSTSELLNAPASIRTLDTNSDGAISSDELRPVRTAGAPERPADAPARTEGTSKRTGEPAHAGMIVPVMLALDANSDGALSVAEIANATTSLKALDANRDDKLTHDELRPLPPAN